MRDDLEALLGCRQSLGATLNAFQDQGLSRERAAAKKFGLQNYRDSDDLKAAYDRGELVTLEPAAEDFWALHPEIGIHASPELQYLFKMAAPYVRDFLRQITEEYRSHFVSANGQEPSRPVISSAVRTERYVDNLRQSGNPNVAKGYTSSHLLGTTVDVSYRTMAPAERAWWEDRLQQEEAAGRIEATKETHQPVYHFMVLPPQGDLMPVVADTGAPSPLVRKASTTAGGFGNTFWAVGIGVIGLAFLSWAIRRWE